LPVVRMMKDNLDTGPNSLVQEIRVRRLLEPEVFLEKLVESLMLKRRQLTLHQNLRNRPIRVQLRKLLDFNQFLGFGCINANTSIMPAAPDTRIPVPTILIGIPADPELDRMFSPAPNERNSVPKPKRTRPMFRYFRVAIFLGDSNSEFLLTNHAIREVPPVMPRIVDNSGPIILSRTTPT